MLLLQDQILRFYNPVQNHHTLFDKRKAFIPQRSMSGTKKKRKKKRKKKGSLYMCKTQQDCEIVVDKVLVNFQIKIYSFDLKKYRLITDIIKLSF